MKFISFKADLQVLNLSYYRSLGYLRKLFFDAKMKKYVRNQGETRCPELALH